MNQQLSNAIEELVVFIDKSKSLNVESRALLEAMTSRDDDEFISIVLSHLSIVADKYKRACNIKEEYGDYIIKYKSLIDGMGEDIIKVTRDTSIGIDVMVRTIGDTLKKLIELNRRLK